MAQARYDPPVSGGIWTLDRRGWHVCDDGATYLIARRLPLDWTLSVRTRLPDLGRRRLAHAVRQDLWRMLQRLRGFAPAVSVTRDGQGVELRAGGAVQGSVPQGAQREIAALLEDASTRAAWVRAAAHPIGGRV